MANWQAWHASYDDPLSSLSRRLLLVQHRIDDILTRHHPRRVLSLCAGDGRDIIPGVARREPDQRPDVVLVELDPELAAAARRRAEMAGVDLTVVTGDAGAIATWTDAVPVDLLLLCGIFGNISTDDIRRTIAAAAGLVSQSGFVVWTRGGSPTEDLRPMIRQWFAALGFEETFFEAEPGIRRGRQPADSSHTGICPTDPAVHVPPMTDPCLRRAPNVRPSKPGSGRFGAPASAKVVHARAGGKDNARPASRNDRCATVVICQTAHTTGR